MQDARATRISPEPPSWARLPFFLAVCLGGSLCLYAPALWGFFQSDDFVLVRLARDFGPLAPWSLEPDGAPIFFRPVVTLSFYLDWLAWGLQPLGYHLTNLLLHGLTAYVGTIVYGQMTASQPDSASKRWAALLVGGLFLAHPSHGEAVAWISGRTDLVATLLGLVSFSAFLRARGRGWAEIREPRPWLFILAAVLFFLALLAKESVIVLPLIALAWEWICEPSGAENSQPKCRRFGGALSLALVLPPYIALRWAALGALVGGYGASRHLSLSPVLLIKNFVSYGIRSFLPDVFSYWPLSRLASAEGFALRWPLVAVLLVLVLLVCAALIQLIRKSRLLRDPLLLFLAVSWLMSLVPVLNLGVSLRSPQGERFLYLASLFAVAIIVRASGIVWMPGPPQTKPRLGPWLVGLWAVVCILGTISSAATWTEASGVARRMIESVPPQPFGGEMTVLNVPDSLNGAYVFRNGLPDAMDLYGRAALRRVRVLAKMGLQTAAPAAVLLSKADGLPQSIRVTPGQAFFLPASDPALGATGPREIEQIAPDQCVFDLNAATLKPETKFYYFTQGELKPVKM